MNCSQCGKQIEDDSQFCRHCGAGQTEDGEPSVSPRLWSVNERVAPNNPQPLDSSQSIFSKFIEMLDTVILISFIFALFAALFYHIAHAN